VDWASALLPYMGTRGVETFMDAKQKSKVFICPSDQWMNLPGTEGAVDGPGYVVFNNVVNWNGKYPINYGINADIFSLVGNDNYGHFGVSDIVNVYGSSTRGAGGTGLPLGAHFYKVHKPAETLLIADCGTRPNKNGENQTTGLDRNDAVYYTTNWNTSGGTLKDVDNTGWLKDRIPWQRHRGAIDVAFCDGHAERIMRGDAAKVRVSPYRFEK
jgi:prepilin-type processing-associated H-X9-DG protein